MQLCIAGEMGLIVAGPNAPITTYEQINVNGV